VNKKKLKIIHTPARFYPDIGGVNKYVLDLSEQLVKTGHTVKVICANEPNSDLKNINGINIRRLKYLFKVTNTNITLTLPFEILRSKFDIIHTHMPTPWSADISILIGKIMKKKTVITIHNDMDKTSFLSKIITEIYLHTIFLLSLSLVDKIIIVNDEWEKSFSNTSNILKRYKNKISFLPNGVNNEFFKPLNIRREKDTVLFVSVLDKHHKFKGLDYLLKAIEIVKESIPDIKLIIVGEGELKKFYINIAKDLNIEKNVEFLGEKKQKDLVKLYSKSSLFVLPSIEIEGFGIVAIESMACKTPVVVTNIVGAAKDIKENNSGLIVPPKNLQALAESIIKILKNPKLSEKMGQNGAELVKERYSWKKIAKSVENTYEKITK